MTTGDVPEHPAAVIGAIGSRLRLVMRQPATGSGGTSPGTTPDGDLEIEALPEVDFVAYTSDERLSGRVRLDSSRLSDMLNTHDEFVLVDALAERLPHGGSLVVSEILVRRNELPLVHAAGPRGDRTLRIPTQAHRIVLRSGRYLVSGRLHSPPGADPLASLRARRPMVPLTYATIEFRRDGEIVAEPIGTIVVKIEPPEGDATRGWGPPWVGDPEAGTRTATYYLSINRNKRSLRLDLRSEAGRDVLRTLLRAGDVVVENFRLGGFERLGFTDEALHGLNPDLVHLAISGFGTRGPDAGKPGYDFVVQAMSGLMSITGEPDGRPLKVGVAISDVVTGLFGAVSVLAGLVALRREEAAGQRIDVSLLQSTLAVLVNQAQSTLATGVAPGRLGNAHPSIVPYETFRTADGEIAIGVGSERQWRKLCDALGLPALATEARFATNADRVANRVALIALLAGRLAERSSADWLAALAAAGIPAGPIRDIREAFESPQAQAIGSRIRLDHPALGAVDQVRSPLELSATPASIRRPPPLLGEHSREILSEAGYGGEDIDRLAADGVI